MGLSLYGLYMELVPLLNLRNKIFHIKYKTKFIKQQIMTNLEK